MTHDVIGVIEQFLGAERSAEQRELVMQIGAALRDRNRATATLVATVARECEKQKLCTPEITIRIALMYGWVMGIVSEQQRARRTLV